MLVNHSTPELRSQPKSQTLVPNQLSHLALGACHPSLPTPPEGSGGALQEHTCTLLHDIPTVLPAASQLPSVVAFLTLGSNFISCTPPTLFSQGWVSEPSLSSHI